MLCLSLKEDSVPVSWLADCISRILFSQQVLKLSRMDFLENWFLDEHVHLGNILNIVLGVKCYDIAQSKAKQKNPKSWPKYWEELNCKPLRTKAPHKLYRAPELRTLQKFSIEISFKGQQCVVVLQLWRIYSCEDTQPWMKWLLLKKNNFIRGTHLKFHMF